nr:MAG TPA: hypothetical protein [Siphoviridae sp. ctmtD6]
MIVSISKSNFFCLMPRFSMDLRLSCVCVCATILLLVK